MTAHIAYTSPNKTKIVWIEMELSFFSLYMTCLKFMCMLGHYVASTVLVVPKSFGGRWQRQWITAQRYRVPLQ